MRWLLALSVAAVLSLPATDSLTDRNAGTLGSNWASAIQPITEWTLTLGVGATSANVGADFNVPFWNADTFGNDQYSQVVLSRSTNGYTGVSVRGSSGNAYGISLESPGCVFYKWVSSVRSTLSSTCGSYSWTNGHTLKLAVVGNALTAYDNGSAFAACDATCTGSSIASGKPGLLGYSDVGGLWTNWQGDNAGGGGATFPAAIINAPIRCCTAARFR